MVSKPEVKVQEDDEGWTRFGSPIKHAIIWGNARIPRRWITHDAPSISHPKFVTGSNVGNKKLDPPNTQKTKKVKKAKTRLSI